MKIFLLLFCILFCSLSSITAQQNSTPESRKNLQLYTSSETVQGKNNAAEQSTYFGYDNKVKEVTINNNIPQNFPTKEGYADKAAYLIAANEWLKAHSALVRPEFINVLIKD